MVRACVLVLAATACGRIGFDRATGGDGGDDAGNAAGAIVDDVFTAGESDALVIERGTSGSYFDATGRLVQAGPMEPRFDHDPVTLAPRGLLIEGAATNLTDHSEQIDDGVEWFANGAMSVIADVAIAPDGTMSAEALNDTDTNIQCRRAQGYGVPNDTRAYTCSGFVKAGTLTSMSFGCELLAGTSQLQASVTIDLVTGALTEDLPDAIGYGAEPVGNGWFRVWIALQNNGTGNDSPVLSFLSQRANNATTGTFLAWGAQLEVGAKPSSYIPNPTLSPVSRDREGARLSIPPSEIRTASVRVVARPSYDMTLSAACMLGAGADRICIDRDAAMDQMNIDIAGTGTVTLEHGAWLAEQTRWAAFTYDMASVEAVTDLGFSGASNTLTSVASQIVLGSDTAVDGILHLERATVWPSRLTPAQLTALSP